MRANGWAAPVALALAAVLVLVSMGSTVANTRQLKEDTASVRHTGAVLLQLKELLSLVKDAETGQRGFVRTGRDDYLQPYLGAAANLDAELKQLDDLVRDNPLQQAKAAAVRQRVDAKLREMQATVQARQQGDLQGAMRMLQSDAGKVEMDALRQAVADMRARELELREQRLGDEAATYTRAVGSGLFSGVAALAALLGLLLYLRRFLALRNSTEAALAAEAEKFRTTLLSIGDAVISTDTQGTVTSLNAVAEQLTGWTRDRAVGQPLATVFHIVNETTRAVVESPVDKALREGTIVGLANHTALLREDGSEIPIDDSAAPIRDATGATVGCVLVFRDVSDRKAAEAALHESDTRLRVTLASIGDAVIATDAMGQVSYLNAAAAQLTGWTAADALGQPLKNVFSVLHETTREPLADPAEQARTTGTVVALANHAALVAKDGSEVAVEDSAAPICDEAGQVIGAVLVFRDVTERRLHLTQLEDSERQFRALADSIPQLCWMADADGSITWYNRRWYDYTGTTFEQMQGWGWQSVHDPAVLPDVMVRWPAAIATGQPFEMVFPLRRADGVYCHFLTRIVPIEDSAGRITRWFGTNTDVTAVVQTQQALQQRERELQTLADNTPDVLARFDRELRHVFVNGAIGKISGIPPERIVGRTNREIGMPEALCELWEEATRAVFASGQTRFLEFEFDAVDGKRHFCTQLIPETTIAAAAADATKTATGVATGTATETSVHHVLTVTHDRTAEVLAQDALRLADRRKDEFLATLAHELRNPLAPLRAGLEVLRISEDPKVLGQMREMMVRQLAHMVRLIDDLLEVSRIASGKVVLRRERMSLQSAIAGALETTRAQVAAANHQLVLEIPEAPIWLDADPTRISQVVSNLVGNATKYSPDGSIITVRAELEGDCAVATVSDNGMGIPEDMLDQVFEMFAQVNRTLDRAQGGLGIGLALVRHLVEMHGGSVVARSAGLGLGSSFVVSLPSAVVQETQASGSLQASGEPSPELRILVVDDNVDAAVSMEQLLLLQGHRTRVAHSGQSAIELAMDFQPDLALLDIGMPGMNGYSTARAFRQNGVLAGTILVALTGWGTDDHKLKSAQAGFDRHLTKPVESRQLDDIIRLVQQNKAAAALNGGRLLPDRSTIHQPGSDAGAAGATSAAGAG